jgi:hypothetical protein
MKDHFNGRSEKRGPPAMVMADEQLQRGISYQTWIGEGNKEGSDGDRSKFHGVKSILHDLPYWKVRTPSISVYKYHITLPQHSQY